MRESPDDHPRDINLLTHMHKKLLISSIILFVAGTFMIIGGLGGMVFTYKSVAAESITTAKDAEMPLVPVRGPLSLKSQADVIRMHTLTSTGGKTFAQMPRILPVLDAAGVPVLDEKGEPVTKPNELRAMWFQAITLMTALHLGIITYAFSLLSLVLGFLFILNGYVFLALRKN